MPEISNKEASLEDGNSSSPTKKTILNWNASDGDSSDDEFPKEHVITGFVDINVTNNDLEQGELNNNQGDSDSESDDDIDVPDIDIPISLNSNNNVKENASKSKPLSKKDRKAQRDNELKELEDALNAFGLVPTAETKTIVESSTSHETENQSENKSSDKKKKKKKSKTASTSTEKQADSSDIPVIAEPVELVDPKLVLNKLKKTAPKKTVSDAEKIAVEEAKRLAEAKKKSKDKSKKTAEYSY